MKDQFKSLATNAFWNKYAEFVSKGNSRKKSYAMAAQELEYIPVRRKNPMFNKPTTLKTGRRP